MVKFTKRQWLILVVISIADFCNAISVSIQAPFYPLEAELKGASATEYGFVFGVFELVVFIVSPICGQYLNRIGPKFLFNAGIYTVAVCVIIFGALNKVEGHYPFIILSYIIRILEGIGNAAFLTATFAMIAKEFPNSVATTFATLETFFGFGLIIGPTVGGVLYEVGGFCTPFAVTGSLLFLCAVLASFILPQYNDGDGQEQGKGPSMLKVLRICGVLLATASIVITSMSTVFLQAILEPHLRKFHLSPALLGLIFIINGGTYAITAPGWGWLCDRRLMPKIVTLLGGLLVAAGFCLIGPAPFIPFDTILWVTMIGLVLHGLGLSAQLVSSFTDALITSIAHGFPDNFDTYGLISGLCTSTFALGAFIGPSLGGILYDYIGFRNASMVVMGIQLLISFMVLIFLLCSRKNTPTNTE